MNGSEQIELTTRTASYLACRLADTHPGGWIARETLDEAVDTAAQSDTWERDMLALAERCAQESGAARGSDYARVIDALDTIRAEVMS